MQLSRRLVRRCSAVLLKAHLSCGPWDSRHEAQHIFQEPDVSLDRVPFAVSQIRIIKVPKG